MRSLIAAGLLLILSTPLSAQKAAELRITGEPLGDTPSGVVTRVVVESEMGDDAPPELVLQGSILHAGVVVRNFRYIVLPDTRRRFEFIATLPAGEITVDARLMIPIDAETPGMLAKGSAKFTVAPTGREYTASANDGVEGIVAEGITSESAGAVRIKPPRRDLAPNLFAVEVDVDSPVQRVEFWVDGKKVITRNAPPYRAELDLGSIPKRVEVKAVGYDRSGRYVAEDAWVVNERDTPLEIKITRTVTPDGVAHFKVSVQNPKATPLGPIEFYAGEKKLIEWTRPPYAIDLPVARLSGVDYVRASVKDSTGYEATDLFFLDGRLIEQIDVNFVELPVQVSTESGVPVTDLKEAEVAVFEDGKPQKVATFGFAQNLPVSLGMVVDHSGSMVPRMKSARSAALKFFSSIMRSGDRAFFGAFSWDPKDMSPMVTDVESLKRQVESMPEPEGGTALYDAIVSALYRFRSVQGRKALVIVTDGEDTTSRLSYEDMLRYVRAARVPIYFIAVDMSMFDVTASSKMRTLAAETGGIAYFVKGDKELDEAYSKLEKELRTQYLVGYYTQSTRTDEKYRTVEVQVKRSGAKVRTIRGFIP